MDFPSRINTDTPGSFWEAQGESLIEAAQGRGVVRGIT
jgi:hypothetical protein